MSTAPSPPPAEDVRDVLALDPDGRPRCRDAQLVWRTVRDLRAAASPSTATELLGEGLLRGRDERRDELVCDDLVSIPPVRFDMGSDEADVLHFCGEAPLHPVALSGFAIASVPVTNELFARFDARWADVPARDRRLPAVGVSWWQAAVFALWLGCRLPTEAEWEYACGVGAASQWCCAEEDDLTAFAWYCESSDGVLHPVGARRPNALGLHDMHGNVWEWCADDHDPDFYARSPLRDPRCDRADDGAHRVCRGGSLHGLAEMCRTRYRLHEPPSFHAADLGFRIAHDNRMR